MVLFCKNSLTLFQFYKCYGENSKRATILKDAKNVDVNWKVGAAKHDEILLFQANYFDTSV